MGSFHAAGICELVCLYLLDHVKNMIDPKHTALYRGDGLDLVNNYSNAELLRVCKKLSRSIKDKSLSITNEPGSRRTNFLDIT